MLGYRAIIWDMSNLLGIVSLNETDYFSSNHSIFFFFSCQILQEYIMLWVTFCVVFIVIWKQEIHKQVPGRVFAIPKGKDLCTREKPEWQLLMERSKSHSNTQTFQGSLISQGTTLLPLTYFIRGYRVSTFLRFSEPDFSYHRIVSVERLLSLGLPSSYS